MKKLILILFLFTLSELIAKEPLVAFKLDSLWYVVDEDGYTALGPLNVENIYAYSEDFYNVTVKMDTSVKFGIMTSNGQIAVTEFDEIRPFKQGLAIIGKNELYNNDTIIKKYGYINQKGQVVVKMNYLEALEFSEDLAWVMNFDERGYINKKGEFVIKKWNKGFGNNFSDGLAAFIGDSGRTCYIDKKGKMKLDFLYDEAYEFKEGLARVNNLSFFGFIDKSGKLIVKYSYDFCNDFSGGYAFVGIPDTGYTKVKWGLINKFGAMMFDFTYSAVNDFSEGIASVFDGHKWKYIDPQNIQIIDKKYDYAESFKNGLAFVYDRETNTQGYINPLGEMIIPLPKEAKEIIDLRFNKKMK